jgi:hypothetical protein
MPYPTEHAARIADPGQFAKIRRENSAFDSEGRPIDALWGVPRSGAVEIQSLRFPVSAWTAAAARAWLNAHDYSPSALEPAMRRVNPAPLRHNAKVNAAIEEYEAAHWGEPSKKVYEVDDPYLPSVVVQMGALRRLDVDAQGHGKYSIELTAPSALVYTQDEATRLYLVLSDKDRTDVLAMLDKLPTEGPAPLASIAKMVGGRQAKFRHPSAQVLVLGTLTHVVYTTTKKGDGKSDYIHELGEDAGGICPALCVDADGRLLLAGGSYVVEHRGIVN